MQKKKIILVKSALLIAVTVCAGFPDKACALEVIVPTSIHEILSPDQIAAVKADPAIKEKRNGIRTKIMTDQAAKMPFVVRGLMSNTVGLKISAEVAGQTSAETVSTQMSAMKDPTSPDGMPVRLAAPETF